MFNYLLDILGNKPLRLVEVMTVEHSRKDEPTIQKSILSSQGISMPILKDENTILGLLNRCLQCKLSSCQILTANSDFIDESTVKKDETKEITAEYPAKIKTHIMIPEKLLEEADWDAGKQIPLPIQLRRVPKGSTRIDNGNVGISVKLTVGSDFFGIGPSSKLAKKKFKLKLRSAIVQLGSNELPQSRFITYHFMDDDTVVKMDPDAGTVRTLEDFKSDSTLISMRGFLFLYSVEPSNSFLTFNRNL